MSEVQKYPASKPAELLKRISVWFPDITWDSYKLVTNGWDHEVIILDNKLVFRFPNDDDYTAALKDEIEVMRRLDPLVKAPIPRYEFVAPDYSFAGYKLIPGEELTTEVFDALSTADHPKVAQQLAELLSTLHNLPDSKDMFVGVPEFYLPDDQKDVKAQVKQYLKNTLNKEDLAVVGRILDEVDQLLSQKTKRVFLHGDVYSRHLFWDQSTLQLGLIDFSDMCLGDPAMDFAELYEYGKEFVEEVYSLYTGPKDENFLKRAWVYQRWVGVYMMTDHFVYHKTTFEVARETFDRIKSQVGHTEVLASA